MANNTDIYIISQKVNNYINRFSFFYNKSTSDINIYEFHGNKMSPLQINPCQIEAQKKL